MTKLPITLAATFLAAFLTYGPVMAQNLPNVQSINLQAPANIKIDGKATEWNNQFQAYNHNANVFYSMANDDRDLYLIIQAKDPVITKKIIAGGIILTINRTGKKEDNTNVTITYPNLELGTKSSLGQLISERETAQIKKQNDSLTLLLNTILTNQAKEITVKGIKAIDDTAISVYNDLGIKANMLFDDKKALTYELSIPLKYLISQDNSLKYYYHITLNGMEATLKSRIYQTAQGTVSVSAVPRSISGGGFGSTYQITNYPTDFRGEYTLFKK